MPKIVGLFATIAPSCQRFISITITGKNIRARKRKCQLDPKQMITKMTPNVSHDSIQQLQKTIPSE